MIVGVPMHDYGCMLRAYRRHIVDTVVACDEKAAFVPALANSFAKRVAEIPVGHDERQSGSSKYNLFRLAHLSLNLITGFSMMPIQAVSVAGILVFVLDALLVLVLLAHRILYGPQQEGALWTLFASELPGAGLRAARRGADRRVRRAHLPGGAQTPDLYRARGAWRRIRFAGAPLKKTWPPKILTPSLRSRAPRDACCSPTTRWATDAWKRCSKMGAPMAALFTHEDDPHEEIWWRSCAELARSHGVPVYTPERLDAPWIERIAAMRPAIIYSFYYRNLLPDAILRTAPLGAYNLHGSLLPAYRGRAPVNWMLVNGEREAGVTLHHMVARADAGDIVGQRAVAIDDSDTALTLYRKLVPLGVALLTEMHPLIVGGTRAAPPAGSFARQLLRAAPPRGRANRLAMAGAAHLQPGARRDASLSGCVLLARRAQAVHLGEQRSPPKRDGAALRARSSRSRRRRRRRG